MSRAVLLFVSVSLLLAGCTASDRIAPRDAGDHFPALPTNVQDALALLTALRADPLILDRTFTVHVVTVGWDVADLDQEAVRSALPADTSPRILFSAGVPDGLRGGLNHRIDYAFHEAPDAFAEELFAVYPDISQDVPIPGGDNGFLARYDRLYDLGRTNGGTMHLVDAQAAERRIDELRTKHGLIFDGPHATVFLLDSFTEIGLWSDSYYWYGFNGGIKTPSEAQNLRAWGGTHDFLFLDRSAAPKDATTDESGYTKLYYVLGSQPVTAAEGTAYTDPPAWHYQDGAARMGQGPTAHIVTPTEATIRALDPAVNVRLLNDYIFRPVLPDRFQVNVHLWHDGRSIVPADAVEGLLDAALLQSSLQAAAHWIPVDVIVKTYVAPEDDPGMDAAIQRAKREGAGAQASMPVLLNHVDSHRDQYGANEAGTVDVMALTFLLEGHFAVVVPAAPGGAAVTGTDLQCWGTATSVNDAFYLMQQQDLDALKATLTHISAHEVGHCFGLPHAHDGTRRTADGYESALDHTWSSTNTTMSYRVDTTGVDHLHRTSIARAHTLDAIEQVLRDLEWAHRALQSAEHASTPKSLHTKMERALDGADTALQLYHAGKEIDAVYAAMAARATAREAMQEAGVRERTSIEAEWETSGVHAVGAKNGVFVFRPAASATGIQYDYRKIPLGADAERVTVRATWTNTPDSWGDFFIGWRAPGVLDPLFLSTGPAEHHVTLGSGTHDVADEGPNDGIIVREFTLELDHYPALRGEDVVFEAGAGTQGSALNGAYRVEIVVERRITEPQE